MLRKFAFVLMFVGMSALATGCVVEVGCTFDSECAVDEVCLNTGECAILEVFACNDDYDCDLTAGEFCDAVTGLCSILE